MREFGGFVHAKVLTPVRVEEDVLGVPLIRTERFISAFFYDGFGEAQTVEFIQGEFYVWKL